MAQELNYVLKQVTFAWLQIEASGPNFVEDHSQIFQSLSEISPKAGFVI